MDCRPPQHGLLRGSCVPTKEWREIRRVVHERRILIEERARVANRVMKLLETGNVKLKSVISDVLRGSGVPRWKQSLVGRRTPKVSPEK